MPTPASRICHSRKGAQATAGYFRRDLGQQHEEEQSLTLSREITASFTELVMTLLLWAVALCQTPKWRNGSHLNAARVPGLLCFQQLVSRVWVSQVQRSTTPESSE